MSICRKELDEEHGNPFICNCPKCRGRREEKRMEKEELRYKFQNGDPIDFYTHDLSEILGKPIWPFETLFELLGKNDDHWEIGWLGKVLIENAHKEIDKFIELIEKNLGKIHIDYAMGLPGCKEGEFLGFNFVPIAKKQEPQPNTVK